MLVGAAIGSLPITTMMLSSLQDATMLAIAGAAGGICFWFSAGKDFRQRRP